MQASDFITKHGMIADHFGLVAGIGFGVAMTATSLPLYVWLFRKDF